MTMKGFPDTLVAGEAIYDNGLRVYIRGYAY